VPIIAAALPMTVAVVPRTVAVVGTAVVAQGGNSDVVWTRGARTAR
jgi:hypothetical protein